MAPKTYFGKFKLPKWGPSSRHRSETDDTTPQDVPSTKHRRSIDVVYSQRQRVSQGGILPGRMSTGVRIGGTEDRSEGTQPIRQEASKIEFKFF